MERYLVVLRSYGRMSPELKEDLRSSVHPVLLKKGEIIDTAEDHVDSIYFIEKGLVQLFKTRKKNEKGILGFRKEDQYIIAEKDLQRGGRLGFSIEALEDCILWNFPSTRLKELFNKHVGFHRHRGAMILKDYELIELSNECAWFENNPDNYHLLRSSFPYLLDRVPIPNLANFIRISETMFRRLHSGNQLSRH